MDPTHRLKVEVNTWHDDPHILGGIVSNLRVLTNQGVYLSNEEQRETHDGIDQRIEIVLSIHVYATHTFILRPVRHRDQCPN